MKIKVEKETERFCSCNNCGARNYHESRTDARQVDTLYAVRIGCMVNRLCPDCLAELLGKVTVALATAE